ncbi:MAG TPA: J domain-containing protein [Ilumatobacteraceae bacterium]|nr:J domain-containing protein [Ilumatobacteraceae bacterium]
MNDDPFATLGLRSDASADDVRAARRELAKRHHPDRGGDADLMQAVNDAARQALRRIDAGSAVEPPAAPTESERRAPTPRPAGDVGGSYSTDAPSFTVEALPVETFEGLLIVASWLGEVLDDDPPYALEVQLHEPMACWCRLDVVPDAGASTVSLTVAGIDGARAPDVIAVRDLWIDQLNHVDWA